MGTAVFIVMLAIGTAALVTVLTTSFDSYATLTGARKLVTVDEPCAGTVCRGAWDDGTGQKVDGTVHVRSDAPSRPFREVASVHGETAYLDGGFRYVVGLAAPWLVLGAAFEIAVQVTLERRRERRRQTAISRWRARYGTA